MSDLNTNSGLFWAILLLTLIGGLRILSILWWCLKNVYTNYLRSGHDLAQRYGKGTWVVVTGGSDGIGKGWCEELASLGFNICIVARNENKMQAVTKELGLAFGIKTKYIVLDFAKNTEITQYEKAFEELKGLDVSILVNNVGISAGGPYHEWSSQKIQDFVTVNIYSQLAFTRYFIPKLLERHEWGQHSAIISMGSLSSYVPVGNLFAMYTGVKKFNHIFSLAIAEELRGKVDVISVTPGGVKSNLSDQYKYDKGNSYPTPQMLVRGALRDLGHQDTTAGLSKFKFTKNMCQWIDYHQTGLGFVIKGNEKLYKSSI
mmetsp:Transcript_61219/g.70147  ORF Transcript_61219/g.70147 Transcript_61219/m.70147 type:complete len:317 (-) Transcript_61219:227-1177(-)